MKKKLKYTRGFTLIELIVTLAILVSIFGYLSIKYYRVNDFKNDIDVELCNNSIVNIINNAKVYCRNNHSIGTIKFLEDNNSIEFCSEGILREKYIFPLGFKLMYINLQCQLIKIDSLGITTDAGTIEYKDRKGELHKITMCVGTSYVEIKE